MKDNKSYITKYIRTVNNNNNNNNAYFIYVLMSQKDNYKVSMSEGTNKDKPRHVCTLENSLSVVTQPWMQ
jgi:hypothetical protein